MHKDYSSGNPVQISVYDKKLIIWNAGQLPDKWTVEKLKIKHPSQPNNPDIANCFFRAGLIEAWGRGTIKILNECKTAQIAPPVFTNEETEFSIEFGYKISNPENLKKTTANKEIVLKKILDLIEADNSITIAELDKKLDKAEITIKRDIKNLQQMDMLKREGGDKIGKWILIA